MEQPKTENQKPSSLLLAIHDRHRFPIGPGRGLQVLLGLGSVALAGGVPGTHEDRLVERVERMRERLTREIEQRIADAAHELRSPLTSLKAALQLGQRRLRRIAESKQPPEDLHNQIAAAQGLLVTAEHQVDRQDRLVGDLLLLAQAESRRLPLDMKPLQLDKLLLEVFQPMRRRHSGC